jgi:hypothetical protein
MNGHAHRTVFIMAGKPTIMGAILTTTPRLDRVTARVLLPGMDASAATATVASN